MNCFGSKKKIARPKILSQDFYLSGFCRKFLKQKLIEAAVKQLKFKTEFKNVRAGRVRMSLFFYSFA
jgi:hypothetical protein